jgi:hypothetical protein
LVVDPSKNTCDAALVLLSGSLGKPRVERRHAARNREAAMFAEWLDSIDHAWSSELPIMALKAAPRRRAGSGSRLIAARNTSRLRHISRSCADIA